MANFRFECDSRKNRNGKHPIYLLVSVYGKRKKTKTHIELDSVRHFNSKCRGCNWIRSSVENAKVLNSRLEDLMVEAKNKYSALESENAATADNLMSKLKHDAGNQSFLQFAKTRANEIFDSGSIVTWKKYTDAISKLESFLKSIKKKDLYFAEVNIDFINRFDNYLHRLPNAKQKNRLLHQNTIKCVFNRIRALVNRAILMGYMSYENNPFLKIRIQEIKTEKEKLTASELQALLDLDLPADSVQWHTRNCFFFSMYCAGIRVGDLLQLRWRNISDDGRLSYQMGKNHKVRDLILVDKAKAILRLYKPEKSQPNNYIFPLLDSSAMYAEAITMAEKDTMTIDVRVKLAKAISTKSALLNKYLKILAQEAGVSKPISMHIARHTFARIAKEQGMDNSILKSLLAHSSLAITERYMGNFDTSTTDLALQRTFDKADASDNKKEKLVSLLAELSDAELSEIIQTARAKQNNTYKLNGSL